MILIHFIIYFDNGLVNVHNFYNLFWFKYRKVYFQEEKKITYNLFSPNAMLPTKYFFSKFALSNFHLRRVEKEKRKKERKKLR